MGSQKREINPFLLSKKDSIPQPLLFRATRCQLSNFDMPQTKVCMSSYTKQMGLTDATLQSMGEGGGGAGSYTNILPIYNKITSAQKQFYLKFYII